jgi:TPR repeat protein
VARRRDNRPTQATGALRLWLPLAEAGHVEAEFRVGVLHDFGQGVQRSLTEAATWYRRAAEQGHAEVQFNLAVMHDFGDGAPQSAAQAFQWFSKAAAQGDTAAEDSAATLKARMTPAEIEESRRRVAAFRQRNEIE